MDGRHDVAAVVLAAGESRRFGSPKQLARVGDKTLLEHVLEAASAADLRPVVAVVPPWLTRPRAYEDPTLIWVRNPDPARGMSHSLRLGFAALPPNVGAAVILLADQPRVAPDHLRALVAARGGASFVATTVDGIAQPPVLIEGDQFAAVMELHGDAGLRDLLRDGSRAVATVPSPPIADVDTPADLR
jgi:molybdenum cofactor cytidylyltransferase